MSNYLTSSGIVLKNIPFQNSSQILNIYTKDYGLLSFIAKGSRRPKSKFLGKTEPFTEVDLVFTYKESRQIQCLTEIEIVNFYYDLLTDLEKIQAAGKIAKILHHTLFEQKPIPGLFEELIRTFKMINNSDESQPQLIVLYFLHQLLNLDGTGLNFYRCQSCNKEIDSSAYLNLFHSNIVCSDCRDGFHQSQLIVPEAVALGKIMKSLDNFEKIQTNLNIIENLSSVYHHCIQQHYHFLL